MRNNRNGAAVAARSLIVAVGLTLSINALTHAQTVATWTGTGGNRNWSNPANWSGGVVPNNTPTEQFSVVIPGTASVFVDAASPPSISLASMNLALGATIQVSTQRTVNVASSDDIQGSVLLDSIGSFNAINPAGPTPTVFRPNGVNVRAAGRFVSNATSIDISRTSGTQGPSLSASEAAAILDLSQATSLTWGVPSGGFNTQTISTIAGTVDLSRLQSMTRVGLSSTLGVFVSSGTMRLDALQSADGVNFRAANSVLRLDSLTSCTNGSLDISNSTAILNALTDVRGSVVTLSSNSNFGTPILSQIDNARFFVANGSLVIASSVTSYTGLTADATPFRVGTGGVFSAPSMTTMTLAPTATSQPTLQFIASGGTLNFPAVTSIARAANRRTEILASFGASINFQSLPALDNSVISATSGSTINLQSLQSANNSTITVTASNLNLPSLTSANGTTIDASSTSTVSLPNLASVDRARLFVASGSQLNVPLLNSINDTSLRARAVTLSLPNIRDFRSSTAVTGGISFNADGAGSIIQLPNLRSIAFDNATTQTQLSILATGAGALVNLPTLVSFSQQSAFLPLTVSATAGGRILLPGLISPTANFRLTASGTNSSLDLRGVEVLDRASLQVSGGATVQMGAVNAISSSFVSIAGPGSDFGPGVRTFENSVLSLSGTSLAMPLLQQISIEPRSITSGQTSTGVSAGVLDWRNVRTITLGNSNSTVNSAADLLAGAGGTFNLSGVTSITSAPAASNGFIRPLSLTATGGGRLNLSALPAISGIASVSFRVDGASSALDLSSLQLVVGPINRQLNVDLTATSAGVMTLPALERLANLTNFTATATGAGSVIRLPRVAALGGTQRFFVNSGGRIELPSVTLLSNPIITVDGPGGEIVLAPGGAFQNANITVNNAGTFTLPASAGTTGFLAASANGNSLIDLSSLQTQTFVADTMSPVTVNTFSGGRVNLNGLTSIMSSGNPSSQTFSIRLLGGRVELNALTSFTSRIEAQALSSGSVITMNALTSTAGGSDFVVEATNGGRVDLPALASLGTGGRRIFSAASGSTLSLPALTSLASAGTTFTASEGGVISAPALVHVGTGGAVEFGASGTGMIDMPQWTTFQGASHVTFDNSSATAQLNFPMLESFGNSGSHFVTVRNSSTLRLPSLTSMRNVEVTLRTGGRLETPNVTDVDGSTFLISAPYTLPPSVTTYSAESRPGATLFSVSSVTLNADSLQSMRIGNATTPGTIHRIRSERVGGVLSFNGLQSITATNGGILDISATQSGVIQFNQLTQIPETNIRLESGGTLITPALTSADALTVSVSGASWTMPSNVTSYASSTRRTSTIFEAIGTSLLNLSSLSSITVGNPLIANQMMEVEARDGGGIDLSNLSTVQSVNGGRLSLDASNGAINASSLTTLRSIDLFLRGPSSSITLGTITSMDAGSISVSNQSFTLFPAVTSYSALDRGTSSIFSASGFVSSPNLPSTQVVDLSPLTSLTVGSTSTPDVVHSIFMSTGTLNLTNLTTFSRVNNGTLRLVVTERGTISAPLLTNFENVRLSVSTGGRILAPAITSFNGSTLELNQASVIPALDFSTYSTGSLGSSTIIDLTGRALTIPTLQSITYGNTTTQDASFVVRVNSGGELSLPALSTLRSVNGGTLQFRLESTGRLIAPSLTITRDTRLQTINASTTVQLSGPLSIATTERTDFDVVSGTFSFQGVASTTVEVAAQNLGIVLLDTSFAMGRLILGTATTPTDVVLVDLFDNGNRGPLGQPEALYLTIPSVSSGAQPGLILNAGSRLTLSDGIDVYFRQQGSFNFTSLRSLFLPGQTTIAFGGGFVTIPSPGAAITLALAGLVATRRRRA